MISQEMVVMMNQKMNQKAETPNQKVNQKVMTNQKVMKQNIRII